MKFLDWFPLLCVSILWMASIMNHFDGDRVLRDINGNSAIIITLLWAMHRDK